MTWRPSTPPSSAATGSNAAARGRFGMASDRTYGRFATMTSHGVLSKPGNRSQTRNSSEWVCHNQIVLQANRPATTPEMPLDEINKRGVIRERLDSQMECARFGRGRLDR